jgi:MFS transporter, DHA1 family, multidrug resistance protein
MPVPPTKAPPRLITLVLLSAIAALPVNMILPSLPRIAETFKADFALVNLSIVGYAVITALTGLIAGSLSDRYGRRPVVLVSLSIFIVASAGCALATNIAAFLLFRAMQASIAACYSASLVIIKETSTGNRAASRIGYSSMGWAIAPMIGPALGGLIDELFGWRAGFVVFAVLGAAILVLVWRDLTETAPRKAKPEGNILVAYGLLLRSPPFWAYTLCMSFSMGTLYIFFGGAPLLIGRLLDGSSAKLGLYMGLVPVGFIFGSYLAGRYSPLFSSGAFLVLGRSLTCLGLLAGLVLSLSDLSHGIAFFGPCMFIGIGNGMTMPGANTAVLSLNAGLAGTAGGLAAAITIAGAAFVAAFAGFFLVPSSAVPALFAMMLLSACLALVAALYAALVRGG